MSTVGEEEAAGVSKLKMQNTEGEEEDGGKEKEEAAGEEGGSKGNKRYDVSYIPCDACGVKEGTKVCTRCHAGYYCSMPCQKAHFLEHKKECQHWDDRLYRKGRLSRPNSFVIRLKRGNPGALLASGPCRDTWKSQEWLIQHMPFPTCSTSTFSCVERHGAKMLHIMATAGNVDGVRDALEDGVYPDVEDWRGNTVLYYMASHPGNPAEDLTEERRVEITALLLDYGADPMRRGSMTNMWAEEKAAEKGLLKLAAAIRGHKYRAFWPVIHDHVNVVPLRDPVLAKLVHRYVDVYWRAHSAHWLCNPNPATTMGNFYMHPDIASLYLGAKKSKTVDQVWKSVETRQLQFVKVLRTQQERAASGEFVGAK